MTRFALVALAVLTILVGRSAWAWSGGPLLNVTDVAPHCAVCHSSMQKEQHRGLPEGVQNALWVENRHYKAIQDGAGGYKDMSPTDRARLLADVKAMDAAASVVVAAPTGAKPGQEVSVTATVKGGGAGGVVGVVLVDSDLKQQARTVAGDGWFIVGAPGIVGPDGQPQTRWTDGRADGLRKNVNSAVIFNHRSDLEKKIFPESKVTWTLRAPQEPGTYTLVAAFFYGTEKASPVGWTEVAGNKVPRGGTFGASGHILMSKPVVVTVR